jgi:hypothetical protein
MNEPTHGPGEDPSSLPEPLRAALEAWTPPTARPEFRSTLREHFLAAAPRAQAAFELGEQEVEACLAGAAPPSARPEFRGRLREDFLRSGSELRRAARRRRVPSLSRGALLLAAAAALVLLFLAPWSDGRRPWRAIEFGAGTQLVVDGTRASYGNSDLLSASFERGDCSLSVGDQELRVLALEEGVLLEFPPGTDLRVLPRVGGERGLLELELLTGGVRVSTSPGFQGRIQVRTPDALISLSGPAAGIDVLPRGTCLCILDGLADLAERSGESRPHRLDRGQSAFVERGSREVAVRAELHHAHARELELFAGLSERYLF